MTKKNAKANPSLFKSRNFDYAELIREHDMATPVRLAYPVIWIETNELMRAQDICRDIARLTNKDFCVMDFKEVPHEKFRSRVAEDADSRECTGAIIFDQGYAERQKQNPGFFPALRSSVMSLESQGLIYVLAGKQEVEEESAHHLTLPPIGRSEILAMLQQSEAAVYESESEDSSEEEAKLRLRKPKPRFSDEERTDLVNNLLGMSDMQIKNCLMTATYQKSLGREHLPQIRQERQRALRSAGLDVLEPGSVNAIGGLDNLKQFLYERRVGWEKGLPAKGILLAGVPGGGKTMVAKATAAVLKIPLVRMDMGRFYSKYIGETEQRFRAALTAVDQISPVVLFIDEMEKSFGASDGQHEVSKRLLGEFLYWLQERTSRVFVVATANRVGELPAELTRSGRWDSCFFVDLPSRQERAAILRIHLAKNDVELAVVCMESLLDMTGDFTGAEIEQGVINAMYKAAYEDEVTGMKHLQTAIEKISPLARARPNDVAAIQRLREDGFAIANSTDVAEPERTDTPARRGRALST